MRFYLKSLIISCEWKKHPQPGSYWYSKWIKFNKELIFRPPIFLMVLLHCAQWPMDASTFSVFLDNFARNIPCSEFIRFSHCEITGFFFNLRSTLSPLRSNKTAWNSWKIVIIYRKKRALRRRKQSSRRRIRLMQLLSLPGFPSATRALEFQSSDLPLCFDNKEA